MARTRLPSRRRSRSPPPRPHPSLNLQQMKLSGFEANANLKWEKIGDIPAPSVLVRHYSGDLLVSVAIDKARILVIDDGTSSDIPESFVRVFDVRNREWSDEAWPSLNQKRRRFSCVVCNGKVYVIGGLNSENESLDTIECLDLLAFPRQWLTLDSRLTIARGMCSCAVIDTQVFIVGGDANHREQNLTSIEILNTKTGQLTRGPDLPHNAGIVAAAVNSELLVFAYPMEEDGGVGEVHTLQQGQPSLKWETTTVFSLPTGSLAKAEAIVIGDCVLLSSDSVYDTKRSCWFDIPKCPGFRNAAAAATALRGGGGIELISFTYQREIHSLKLKYDVRPLTTTISSNTKKLNNSMLFSPESSDVTFVCPDGTEIAAHRNVLTATNPYFQAYFRGPWAELRLSGGRWETEKSSVVIKAVLTLIYTGEIPLALNVTGTQVLELLETVYEFALDDDRCRVCQAMCMENINHANVKDLLLSAKRLEAFFLSDACLKFVSQHFKQFILNRATVLDVINYDDGQLWDEIIKWNL